MRGSCEGATPLGSRDSAWVGLLGRLEPLNWGCSRVCKLREKAEQEKFGGVRLTVKGLGAPGGSQGS